MQFKRLISKTMLLILLGAVLLSACSTATQAQPGPTETGAPGTYPLPVLPTNPVPPYPVDNGNTPTGPETYVIPEPGTDTGVVIGQLIDQSNGEPLAYYTIYLATKLTFQNSSEYSYTLDPVNSPHTTSDSKGRFAIGEAAPGNYIIMIWTPLQSSVVMDASTGKEVDVVITAGQTTDVGEHKVTNPLP